MIVGQIVKQDDLPKANIVLVKFICVLIYFCELRVNSFANPLCPIEIASVGVSVTQHNSQLIP